MDNLPLISIVTVVYNDIKNIEKTILSVINQSYPYFEYIIIDGNSTDGTIDVINKYAGKLAFMISEPDNGIYDAMNKGLEKASGEWIHFLNSGDVYCNQNVLQDVFHSKNVDDGFVITGDYDYWYKNIDLLYGDIVLKYPFGLYRMNCRPDVYKPSYVRHPGCFIRTKVMKLYKYDTQYKISADTNFLKVCWDKNHEFKHLPVCITIFDSYSGMSSNNKILSYVEDMQICNMKKNSSKWKKGYLKAYISQIIHKISPTIYGRLACYSKNDRIQKWNPEIKN